MPQKKKEVLVVLARFPLLVNAPDVFSQEDVVEVPSNVSILNELGRLVEISKDFFIPRNINQLCAMGTQ